MRSGIRLVEFVVTILERLLLIHVPSQVPREQPLAA